MKGKWTVPGDPLPSSHLISASGDRLEGQVLIGFRCGRFGTTDSDVVYALTDDPPATGKTCETCLRLSRRDG